MRLLVLLFFINSFFSLCQSTSDLSLSQKDDNAVSNFDQANDATLERLLYDDINVYEKIVTRRYKKAVSNGDSDEIVRNLINMGKFHAVQGNFDLAEKKLLEALHYLSLSPNLELESLLFQKLGLYYSFKFEYVLALDHAKKSIKVAESIKDKQLSVQLKSDARYLMSQVYSNLGMIDESRSVVTSALKEIKSSNSSHSTSLLEFQMGFTYLQEKKPTKGIPYILKAIQLADPNETRMIAEFYASLGDAYHLSKEYSAARFAIGKAISYYEERNLDSTFSYFQNLLRLASLNLSEKKDLDSTILIGEKVLNGATKLNLEQQIYYASDILYRAHKEKGNMKLALNYKELTEEYAQKLNVRGKSEKVKLDRIHSQLLNQERQYRKEQELQTSKSKASRYTLVIVISIIVAITLLILTLYFRSYRKHQKTRKQLMLQISQLASVNNEPTNTVEATFNPNWNTLNAELINLFSKNNLNETDWKVITVLQEDSKSTNQEIADKIHMSYDGVVSSLRKMYKIFNIQVKKHHKLELLLKLYTLSKNNPGSSESLH